MTSGRQLRETHQNYARYSLLILALQIDFDQLWRENMMIGWHERVVTLLEKECNNLVLWIWYVPHQLDIVVKNAT